LGLKQDRDPVGVRTSQKISGGQPEKNGGSMKRKTGQLALSKSKMTQGVSQYREKYHLNRMGVIKYR